MTNEIERLVKRDETAAAWDSAKHSARRAECAESEMLRSRKSVEYWHDRAGIAEEEADRLRAKIDLLSEVVSELSQALNPHYMMSKDGRKYLAKMAKALNA